MKDPAPGGVARGKTRSVEAQGGASLTRSISHMPPAKRATPRILLRHGDANCLIWGGVRTFCPRMVIPRVRARPRHLDGFFITTKPDLEAKARSQTVIA
jgi:hypothetical protein